MKGRDNVTNTKKQITYAERLVKILKQTENYYLMNKKPVENYKYMDMIIPSMRVVAADVIARCAVNYDKQVELTEKNPDQYKLADFFHNWKVDATVPATPVMTLHNKYSKELVKARCIMDISKEFPKKNLRLASSAYSFYLAYSYLIMFYWEAGFIKDDVMSCIMLLVMKAEAEAMLSGDIQKVFLKLVQSWCRDTFEQLKEFPEKEYGVDEKLEKIILKEYFSVTLFNYDKIFFEMWGEDDYDDFFRAAENQFLIDLINAEESFIREESGVINRIQMHTQSEKLVKTLNETKARLEKVTGELEETKKRARQSEKELAAVQAAINERGN